MFLSLHTVPVFAFLLQCSVTIPFAQASVFITHPYKGISCSGGSPCSVTWADDGRTPLLAAVGRSDFALFQGTNTLVQQLAVGLDVSQTHEFTFTPNPSAGPNSDSYWIRITSNSARDPNDTSQAYSSFSGFFTLENMSGTAGDPVASLTSPLVSSVPSTSSVGSRLPSSITNGVVSTTILSGVIPSGSASTLSSALSALSAISSAASGSSGQLLTTPPINPSSTIQEGSGSGTTNTALGASGNSGSSAAVPHFIYGPILATASTLIVLAMWCGIGLL